MNVYFPEVRVNTYLLESTTYVSFILGFYYFKNRVVLTLFKHCHRIDRFIYMNDQAML